MSRGDVRHLIKRRIEVFVGEDGNESIKLPYKGGGTELRAPAVHEESVSLDNDQEPDAPCFVVKLGPAVQEKDSKTVQVTVDAMVYAADSEQGYRDAENVVEALETYLIADPWLDGRYKLVEPWRTELMGSTATVFGASLSFNVEMPSATAVVGPDGTDLAEMI